MSELFTEKALMEIEHLQHVIAEKNKALAIFANRDNWWSVRLVGLMPSKPWEFAQVALEKS